MFLLRYDKANARVSALKQTMEGLSDALLSHEARLNEVNEKREALDADIEALEGKLADARKAHSEETERLHEAELSADRRAQKHSALLDADGEAQKRAKAFEERLERLRSMDAEGGEQTDQRAAALSEAREALQQTQDEMNAALALANAAEEALDQHKTDILSALNRASDARDLQTRQQAIKTQMIARAREVDASVKELSDGQGELFARRDAAIQMRDDTQKRFDALRAERAEAEKTLAELLDQVRKLTASAQALNLSMQADVSRRRLMEEMSRDMEGYQQAVRRALDFARDDARVRGVLARLIEAPKELETAIDMVLGGALQNIVTRDEDAAKRVIDYLRQNRLGRATFLPMTSVRSRVLSNEERRLLSMPGCLGVASELVHFDEEYRGVVENLLGRTVVADNLEHGIPIMRAGRHAFRLVTLAGDVMHSGGSMTGGTAQGRATSLLGREREIKELREQAEKKKAELSALQARIERANADYEAKTAAQKDALERVHQEEIAVAREQERLGNAEAELKAHLERLARTKDAQKQLADSIAEIERDLEEAKAAAQTVSVDQKAMEEKTTALQSALYAAREKADALREAFTARQLQLSDETHELDTLRRDSARRHEEMAAARAALDQIERETDERLAQRLALEAEMKAGAEALASCRARAEETARMVDALESERLAKAAMQRECVREADETHRRYDEDAGKQHRAELALTRAQSDLDQMCAHILNAYELTYAGAEALRGEEPFDLAEGEKEAASLRARIRELGMVNVAAIEEFAQEKERYDALSTQRDDLIKAKADLESLIERLLKQMEKLFVGEFEKLGAYFTVTFERLFGGGQAELKLADESDPLNCGIDIIAQPPGKKLQLLSLLSGGERALTAIAILFAMLKLKPTPFCILDEIEAALDEANIANFADYLAEYRQTTQFVVVTHRKGTMERCDALYGVAMEERGVSRMVSVNLSDYQG